MGRHEFILKRRGARRRWLIPFAASTALVSFGISGCEKQCECEDKECEASATGAEGEAGTGGAADDSSGETGTAAAPEGAAPGGAAPGGTVITRDGRTVTETETRTTRDEQVIDRRSTTVIDRTTVDETGTIRTLEGTVVSFQDDEGKTLVMQVASTGKNACGGNSELPIEPGTRCGADNAGKVVCDGPETVRCAVPVRTIERDVEVDDDDGGKVVVCHVPPGNPANAHTISVGSPAVDAHLNHGDYLGECDGSEEAGGKGKGKGKKDKGNEKDRDDHDDRDDDDDDGDDDGAGTTSGGGILQTGSGGGKGKKNKGKGKGNKGKGKGKKK